MVLIPQALAKLKGNDASFETASSSSIQTLKLYYVSNVVTRSLGLVLYHNKIDRRKMNDDLQNKGMYKWNVVVPSAEMLEIALKLERVHTFGDISVSQLLEKINWLTEIATTEG